MSLDNEAPLYQNGEMVMICRGCDLGGDLYVLTQDQRCELCEHPEVLTAKMIEDLAMLIPRKPRRTGSNPLFLVA